MKQAIFACIGLLFAASAAIAETRPIDDFFGRFVGMGIADKGDADDFEMSYRDLVVDITSEADGFKIVWTTVFFSTAFGSDIESKEKSAALTFVGSTSPNRFDEAGSDEPNYGAPVTWAAIIDDSLIITTLTIKDNGEYDLTSYERRLTDDGMKLVFKRFTNGAITRRVRADLVREAP
jgi:hypothetical protein